jgi:hypothetical protein
MPSMLLNTLKFNLENGPIDKGLQQEAAHEIGKLSTRIDMLEEVLIMIVRTGWPWDEEGEPNAIHACSKAGFTSAMIEARQLLGLDHLSTITRSEPRT